MDIPGAASAAVISAVASEFIVDLFKGGGR
jgi:hypothetical protein